jgi:hypothetical protein
VYDGQEDDDDDDDSHVEQLWGATGPFVFDGRPPAGLRHPGPERRSAVPGPTAQSGSTRGRQISAEAEELAFQHVRQAEALLERQNPYLRTAAAAAGAARRSSDRIGNLGRGDAVRRPAVQATRAHDSASIMQQSGILDPQEFASRVQHRMAQMQAFANQTAMAHSQPPMRPDFQRADTSRSSSFSSQRAVYDGFSSQHDLPQARGNYQVSHLLNTRFAGFGQPPQPPPSYSMLPQGTAMPQAMYAVDHPLQASAMNTGMQNAYHRDMHGGFFQNQPPHTAYAPVPQYHAPNARQQYQPQYFPAPPPATRQGLQRDTPDYSMRAPIGNPPGLQHPGQVQPNRFGHPAGRDMERENTSNMPGFSQLQDAPLRRAQFQQPHNPDSYRGPDADMDDTDFGAGW